MTASASPPGIAAAVFDMDGTLLDTEPLYRRAMFAACAEIGYEMTDELHRAQVGIPTDGARQLYYDAYGDDFPYDHFRPRMHELMAEIETETEVQLKKGAYDLLTLLEAQGIPAAIVTSSNRAEAPGRLKRAGIFDLFKVVITRDDTEKGKPHPEPFRTAAERLGIAPQDCLALEDSPNGIRAAHAAGMVAVMVPDLVSPTDETIALCDAVHTDLDAVRLAYFAEMAI